MARNALLADGTRSGKTDPLIEGGIDVTYACERILAAASAGVPEVWLGRWPLLRIFYFAHYMPSLAHRIMVDAARKGIAAKRAPAE